MRDLPELLLGELREERHLLDQLDLAVLTETHVATVTAFRPLGYLEEVEVVPAIFGAAAGLAGLLLVFLGVSISAFQSFAGAAPAAATAGFRRAATWPRCCSRSSSSQPLRLLLRRHAQSCGAEPEQAEAARGRRAHRSLRGG